MRNARKITAALALACLLAGCALSPPASTPWRRVRSTAYTQTWFRQFHGRGLAVVVTEGSAAYNVAVSDGRRAIVVTYSPAAARQFAEEFAAGLDAPPQK